MVRAIIAFAVVILAIAEIRAQDGDDTCGGRVCTEDQCCMTRRIFGRNSSTCRNKPSREYQLCGGIFSCPECAGELECRLLIDRGSYKLGICRQNTSTSTSASTESSSTVTSTSTESVSTGDSTDSTATIGGQ